MRGNGTRMNVREAMAVLTILLAWAPLARAQGNAPLKLEQTIPLPDVQGRIDHLSLDVAGQRLFVSSGKDGTVKVFDGTSFQLLKTVEYGDDADNLRYDSACERVYVGFGGGALG